MEATNYSFTLWKGTKAKGRFNDKWLEIKERVEMMSFVIQYGKTNFNTILNFETWDHERKQKFVPVSNILGVSFKKWKQQITPLRYERGQKQNVDIMTSGVRSRKGWKWPLLSFSADPAHILPPTFHLRWVRNKKMRKSYHILYHWGQTYRGPENEMRLFSPPFHNKQQQQQQQQQEESSFPMRLQWVMSYLLIYKCSVLLRFY